MPIRSKDMVKLLKKHGFKEQSQRRSHLKMYNAETKKTTIVPIGRHALGIGLKKTLKQAGIH